MIRPQDVMPSPHPGLGRSCESACQTTSVSPVDAFDALIGNVGKAEVFAYFAKTDFCFTRIVEVSATAIPEMNVNNKMQIASIFMATYGSSYSDRRQRGAKAATEFCEDISRDIRSSSRGNSNSDN